MPVHRTTRFAASIAVLALAITLGSSVGSFSQASAATPAEATNPHRAHRVTVHAHWENPPDSFVLSPPCTQTEYIPLTGLCHGTGAGNATITGSWQGTTTYVYGFVTTPANLTHITILETFTGTITGCGTGTMTYRLTGTVSATGTISDTWETVPDLGSGDLVNVTGSGAQLGTYNPDFTQTGDFTGHLYCGHTH
jgi:hypothetical protein